MMDAIMIICPFFASLMAAQDEWCLVGFAGSRVQNVAQHPAVPADACRSASMMYVGGC